MVHQENLPDPYVRLFLLPDSKNTKKQTKSIRDTLNPTYEDTFQWKIEYDEFKKRQLEVCIKNNKPMFSNEKIYIGQLTIDLSRIDVNTPISGWFGIRESGNSMERI
jgi:Ca2+-dependent lipid-binding protein